MARPYTPSTARDASNNWMSTVLGPDDAATSGASLPLPSGSDDQTASLAGGATGHGVDNLYRHRDGTITIGYNVKNANARTHLLKLNSPSDARWRVEEDRPGGVLIIRMPDDLENGEGGVIGALKMKLSTDVWRSLSNPVKSHIVQEYKRKVSSDDHKGLFKNADADSKHLRLCSLRLSLIASVNPFQPPSPSHFLKRISRCCLERQKYTTHHGVTRLGKA